MALDRWIAIVILVVCIAYGYTAFFTMDELLPPIMRRSPIWPSSFPKVLAVGGIVLSMAIIFGIEKTAGAGQNDIDVTRLGQYKFGQALMLLGLMVAYALLLRPLGFLASTFAFLFLGSFLLGERRLLLMATVSAIAAGFIWYLVNEVLGIFLSPLPLFLN